MSTTYWMIEKSIDGRAHWWMRKPGQFGDWMAPERWTADASQARHYPTKDQAEFVMGNQMPGCVATEHMDIPV